MLRLLRPRRGKPTSRKASCNGAGAGAANGATNGGSAAAAAAHKRPGKRRRVHCILLLHAACLAALTAATVTSIVGRHVSHHLLAYQLLHGSASGASFAGSPASEAQHSVSMQECGDALQLPQVALLFLVKGSMHHEAMWRLWFQSAAGLLPLEAVEAAACPGGAGNASSSPGEALAQQRRQQRVLRACGLGGGAGSGGDAASQAAAQQAVHTAADFPATEPPGVLRGALQHVASGTSSAQPGRTLQVRGARRVRPGTKAAGLNAEAVPPAAKVLPPLAGVLGQQALFDVYIHPHPSFPGYPPGSLFHGRELPQSERVMTEWGQHSLVDAARALLRSAHRNPRVTKFVLLSESDLPLYSPQLLYTQLLSEPLSRLNACNDTRHWRLFDHRWVWRMESEALKEHHWRKTWQWFALTRAHVEVVLADTVVDASFRAHCRTMFEEDRGEERECYSDEHYIPTLLAVHGRDNETDCQGWLMDTDWSRVDHLSPHPWEYEPEELSAALLQKLRHTELRGCRHSKRAAALAREAFMPSSDLAAAVAAEAGADGSGEALEGMCGRLQQRAAHYRQRHQPLGPRCRLLARKFLNNTAAAALAVIAPCDSRTGIVNTGTCPGETPAQVARRRAWERWAPAVLLALGLLLLPLLAALFLAAMADTGSRRSVPL